MTFTRRRINVQFQLGQGNFGNGGFDTVSLEGRRISASITNTGGIGMSDCSLRIYGMKLDLMNKLSILGKNLIDNRNNVITVMAGDDDSGMGVAFIGTISEAWADLNSAPDAAFIVVAHAGLTAAMKPIAPTSYKGTVDVALVMAGLAKQMGFTFENSGVSAQISNPYLPGTARDQAYALARAADVNLNIANNTLAIWPKKGARGGTVPIISKATGMKGYPTTTQNGLQIETLYNPSIVYGGQVKVESLISIANGTWNVFNVAHELESETPGGKWFTMLECSILGGPVPIG